MRKSFSKKIRFSSLLNKICLKIIKIPMRIISKCRKIMKCYVLIGLERPNRSKTIKNRKIHPGELSEFFSFFFAKFYFSHFFQVFSSAPWRDFRHFARSPMQSTLLLAGAPKSYWREHQRVNVGRCASPDRPNLENLDFEMSKNVKNIAKKYFL